MLKGKQLLAYTAGVFDSEGCISITKYKTKSKRGYNYALIASVWNTNLWLPQWLKMNYGGSLVHPQNWEVKHPTWKQQWKWSITGKQAAEFLELIAPYLYLKRSEAELAIAFQRKKCEYFKTEPLTVLLEAERILLSKMNRRGRGNSPT